MSDTTYTKAVTDQEVPILDEQITVEAVGPTGKTAAELLADARARHPELTDDADLLEVVRAEAEGEAKVSALDVMRTRGYGLVTRPEPPRTGLDGLADAQKLADEIKGNKEIDKAAKDSADTQAKADTDRAEREAEVAEGIAAVKAEQEVAVTEAAIEREARLNPDGDSAEVKAGKAKAAKKSS